MKAVRLRMEEMDASMLYGWTECMSRLANCGPYGLPAWGAAIADAYGLDTYCVVVEEKKDAVRGEVGISPANGTESAFGEGVRGVLPIVHISHWLFGNSLVAMPFCDGGVCAVADGEVQGGLISAVCDLAEDLDVPVVELRAFEPFGNELDFVPMKGRETRLRPMQEDGAVGWAGPARVEGDKVRMLLGLPGQADELMRSFKAKLRSQINKPKKEGLTAQRGSVELLDDFYRVFVENMRDLGSPVHSKAFFRAILRNFGSAATVFLVYHRGIAVAGSIAVGFKDELANPWASSLRRFGRLAPNMLLYWSMLEYACENGYRRFDFGRSTIGEGTYRFKEQWGARPEPLYWYRFTRMDRNSPALDRESGSIGRAVAIWKRLPLPVTRILGPRIRRHISL